MELKRHGWALLVGLLLWSAPSVEAEPGRIPDDLQLLAQVVCGEARHETYEVKVGVAAVVLNRTRDPRFPAAVAGVVYQPHAFPAVHSGEFYRDTTPECYRAARAALRGLDPTGGALYVLRGDSPRQAGAGRPVVREIGRFRFAR